jgi:long-chain acyl-CoA synthetase
MRAGFYGGDPLKLVPEDLPALRPTFFPSVPRIYNRIFGKIKDNFA